MQPTYSDIQNRSVKTSNSHSVKYTDIQNRNSYTQANSNVQTTSTSSLQTNSSVAQGNSSTAQADNNNSDPQANSSNAQGNNNSSDTQGNSSNAQSDNSNSDAQASSSKSQANNSSDIQTNSSASQANNDSNDQSNNSKFQANNSNAQSNNSNSHENNSSDMHSNSKSQQNNSGDEANNTESQKLELSNKSLKYFQDLFKKHMDIQITEKQVKIDKNSKSNHANKDKTKENSKENNKDASNQQHAGEDTYLAKLQKNKTQQDQNIDLIFIYSDTMVSQSQITDIALPGLNETFSAIEKLTVSELQSSSLISWDLVGSKDEAITLQRLYSYLFEGNLIIYIAKLEAMFTITLPSYPQRSPGDAASETSIQGSRDGLIEDISSNVALIRRRIRSMHLVCHTYNIGELTNTKVAVLYMDNKISKHVKSTLLKRIENINVESMLTIGEMEQLISGRNRFYSFPVVDHSGRPDYIAKNILEGRFVVLVDNNPIALMGPCNLTTFLRSPEDSYFPVMATNIGILIRALSLLITVFLPSFYIAITMYHPDQIPFQLLSTIGIARVGLPVEAPLELFLIMVLMELFREATFRMPSSIAQTVTVVGGLIIGEASINAGLVSPIIVVIAALTIVASATLVNQTVTSTAVLLRFISYIFSSLLGMLGFILSFFTLLVILTRIRSFGVPYLVIMTPAYWGKLAHSFLELPMNWLKVHRNK